MTKAPALHLRDVEVRGRVVDVLVTGGRITAVGPDLRSSPGARAVDGGGGAVLPGLHDHHLHLAAMAARVGSVRVGPPAVRTREELGRALAEAHASAPAGAWLRCVDYHESVAGDLDRHDLDALVPARPVRVQHRSGAMWLLNSRALDAVAAGGADHPGIERDDQGRPTGRIYRADAWLRDRWPTAPLDFAAVGRQLAAHGVTGVTDATPAADVADWHLLAGAAERDDLPVAIQVTGGPALAVHCPPSPLRLGPVKLIVEDHQLPPLDQLVADTRTAHGADRAVAVHCVTRVALVLALAALDEAGVRPGDRIEHAAVADPDLAASLARRGLVVVTQPGFVAARGDEYLAEVEAADRPHLYPCRSLLDAGVAVGGSTDAPFTDPDPWRAVRAAVDRRTRTGAVLGATEALDPQRALALFLARLDDPGGPRRQVRPGAPADLCVLDRPLARQLTDPDASAVRLTIHAGHITHEA